MLNIFIGLLLPAMIWSQPSRIDSLEQLLDTSIHDTARLDVLDQLFSHYINKDLDKSLSFANRLLVNAEEAKIQKYVCKAYSALGTVHNKMNLDLDTIILNLQKAMDCFEAANDLKNQAKVLNTIGGAYHSHDFPAKAMSYFQEGLSIAESINDTLSIIRCLANIASVHKERIDYDKSLSYSRQALAYARDIGHELYTSMILNNIANIYFNWQSYDTALVLYEEALEIKRKVGSELSLVITLANIGGIHVEEQRYELAQQYLDEAYTLATELNYPYGEGLSLRYMVSSAMRQQEYDRAIQLSYKGLASLEQKIAMRYSRDFHKVLSQAYEHLNQTDSALAHLKISKVLNDSIFQAEKEQQIQQLEINYQVNQKDLENKLLKTEKSLIQRRLRNRTYVSISLVIILILGLGWGVAVYRNNRAKKRMNSFLEAQVAERTADLQVANKQLEQANYELKILNHVASHDFKEPIRNMGSYISLIFRKLPNNIKEEMQDYFNVIRQSAHQLYTLIEDIARYSHLSKDEYNIRKEVDLKTVVSNVEVGLQPLLKPTNGRIIYDELPTILSNSSLVFVALKNLIENGIKFNESPEPTVKVHCQTDETHHHIIVSDNGIGVAPRYQKQIFEMFNRLHGPGKYQGSGIGLAIVKLGVEKLGGTIKMESQTGKGSTFTLILPK